jgi:hypothetical protein
MSTPFLNREQAAAYVRNRGLPLTKNTLMKYATVGGGPEFQKFGCRVVYTPAKIDQWIESRLSAPVGSTSEAA